MNTTTSLEAHMKKLAVGWTSAGLALTVGLTLSVVYILPFHQAEDQIRTFGAAVAASRRSDIIGGDVLAAEVQIQSDLMLTTDEQAVFLDPEMKKYVKNDQILNLTPCPGANAVCHDYMAHKVVSYTPIYYDGTKQNLWGYLYIEKHFQTNWAMIALVTLAIFFGMIFQAGGFYLGLSRAMKTVGQTLRDWARKLSVDPRNRENYKTAPFTEIAPIALALTGLRTEIDQLEEIARKEGALSTLRSVGHDILNPVARLKRNLGSLEEEGPNRFVLDRELVLSLHANVQRLSVYAEQLKFIYKRGIGDIDNECSITNVSLEARKIANEIKFDPDAIDKNVTVKFNIDGNCYCRIPVASFGRMVENLCANSIHASDRGGVVELNVEGQRDSVVISIIDNGHGIPDDMKARIFDAGVTSRPNRGTGLGLFVVKQICEQYSGTLHLESEVGKGTAIRIEFPRLEAKDELSNLAR